MATKKEEAKSANVLEGFWENSNLLEKAEQSYLQMLESQKQWIETANDQVTQWEDNAKKLTTDWKHIVQDGITNNTKLPIDTNSLNWFNHLEEITHKSQSLSFIPAKTSLELLSQTHTNFSTLYTDTLKQQQKTRSELYKPFENALDQWKKTFIQAFEVTAK